MNIPGAPVFKIDFHDVFLVQPSAYLLLQYVVFVCDVIFDLTLPHEVGRMMMNLRGLILDDPEHTTHLQTLEFVQHTNTGSQAEEAA